MDERYVKIGSPAARLVEECGEVIQAVMKCERFGFDSCHPDTPGYTNLSKLESEVKDVNRAFSDLDNHLMELR